MFIIPDKQRVLSPEEYAALGYKRLDNRPLELSLVPDKPLSQGLNLPVYRADTKEQYAIDLAVGIVKVGYAYSTGGLGMAGKTSVGYVWSLLT
tara:strand:+ start:59 stop:337 length:279 start_codon:yes stop_codon:yes gene_type:complete